MPGIGTVERVPNSKAYTYDEVVTFYAPDGTVVAQFRDGVRVE